MTDDAEARMRAVAEADGDQVAAAIAALHPNDAARALAPVFEFMPDDIAGRGLGVSPGIGHGRLALTAEQALAWAAEGHSVILLKDLTSPEDLPAMLAAAAVATCSGSNSSHAAVVARAIAVPCVVSVGGSVDFAADAFIASTGAVVHAGAIVAVDGTHGVLAAGTAAARSVSVTAGPTSPAASLVNDAARVAREIAQVSVLVNAETGATARRGLDSGAAGVGLCRTEHIFLGDGVDTLRRALTAPPGSFGLHWKSDFAERQRAAFTDLLTAADGRPISVRLLDPPTHEYLPGHREINPVVGVRGARIGVRRPDLYELQTEALAQASMDVAAGGQWPDVRILVPLVTAAGEFAWLKQRVLARWAEATSCVGTAAMPKTGAMIETPRAALCAREFVPLADFLAVGSNDLTQLTWAIDRDQGLRAFSADYLARSLMPTNPFETIEPHSVGLLIKAVVDAARSADRHIPVGVCGEAAVDPASMDFLTRAGVDYVSCAAPSVPLAWLLSARASVSSAIRPSVIDRLMA